MPSLYAKLHARLLCSVEDVASFFGQEGFIGRNHVLFVLYRAQYKVFGGLYPSYKLRHYVYLGVVQHFF
jgi:hypothetical protein